MAETLAQLFVGLDRTFAALASVAPFISDTISAAPATLAEGTRSLPAVRPFLEHSERFFAALEPGAEALAETSPTIAAALHAGVPVLNESPRFTRELEPTADALLDFQAAPGVRNGLRQLTGLSKTLDPTLHFLAPVQTTCNYLSILFGNFASTGSQSDGLGTWTRFIAFTPPFGPNDEGSPASAPADGPTIFNHLHYNPYPNTDSPGQPRECEAGNEIYEAGETVIGNPPGVQSIRTSGSDQGPARGRDAVTPPEDERARYRAAHHQARRRLPSPLIGALLLIVAIVGPYIAFRKHIPFTGHGYELTATFRNAVAIAPKSPVRIAGVDVGEVLDTSSAGRNTDVRFTVDEEALPVSSDAQVKIRPRIFLEGNYFLELDPGSPSAPELASGETIPVGQTATAVQFDEILTALQAPQRNQLGRLLEGYGTALTHQPTAAEDETQDPRVRGLERRRGAQPLVRLGRQGRPRRGAGRRGVPGDRAARPLVADLGRGAHLRRALRARAAAPRPGLQLEPVHRGAGRGVGEPRPHPPRAPGDARDHPHLARQPQPDPPGPPPVGARVPPRARRAAGDDRGREPVARPGAAAALQARGRRAREHDPAGDAGPRRRERGRPDHAAGDLAAQPLHDRGPDPDRQPGDRGPVLHRPAELPGVLLHHGQPRRREPELRRQRPVPAPAAAASAT